MSSSNRRTNSMRHTTEMFIERSKNKFGKKFSYPNTKYINAHTNIELHCNDCKFYFNTSPNRHIRSKYGCCLSCQRKSIGNIKRKPIEKFIEESKEKFGEDKFLYDNFIYKNQSTPGELLCIECDISFNIAPKNHLQSKSGCCPLCGNGTMTEEIWLLKANKVHPNNEYSYKPDFVYTDCYTKLDIYCNHCQEWFKQNTTDHFSGRGCKNCGCRKRAEKRLSNKEEFIEKAIKIHSEDLFDYTDSIYTKSSENIDIKCNKCLQIFTLTPNKHLGGRGCTSEICRLNKLKEDFIKKSIEKYDKGKYDYSLVDYTDYKNLKIICISCKYQFIQSSHGHLSGDNGCLMCGKTNKSNTDIYIRKVKLKHGANKFNFEKTNYIGSNDIVEVYCNVCQDDFRICANKLLNGRGCQRCGYNIMSQKAKYTKEDFIKKSVEFHGENIFNYSLVNYIDSKTKVTIICNKCNKNYEIEPRSHYNTGCTKCNHMTSKPAREWIKYISYNKNIQHFDSDEGEYKIPNTNYKADGYNKDTNTIYEFHGDFWHGNPKKFKLTDINPVNNKKFGTLFSNTMLKELICKKLGYNYVCIWEYEFDHMIYCVKNIQKYYRHFKCSKV